MPWIMLAMLAIATLIVAFAIHARNTKRHTSANLQQTASLAACRTLLALVTRLQQHRGLSIGLLSGDRSFQFRLSDLENEIEKRLPNLTSIVRLESKQSLPCLTRNELALFRHHWTHLCEQLPELSVEQSVAQHTMMIDQLLKWLGTLSEARLELAVSENQRVQVRNFMVRLPSITECLGQARAMGMGVATRRGCSAVSRVRLMFLVSRAEALLNQIDSASDISVQSSTARSAVQHMARVIRTQMLQASGITVTPEQYFRIATSAIDAVFAWIDGGLSQLERSLARHET